MRRYGIVLMLLPLLLLAAGCPFESKVPLGTPAPGSIDPQLLGEWVYTEAGRPDSSQLLVFPFNDSEYYVEVLEKDGSHDRYRAFEVPVGGQRILQINELGSGAAPDAYVFARYSIAPNGALSLRFIGEQIVPKALATDPRGLIDFIASHRDDPALDDEETSTMFRRQAHDEKPIEKGRE